MLCRPTRPGANIYSNVTVVLTLRYRFIDEGDVARKRNNIDRFVEQSTDWHRRQIDIAGVVVHDTILADDISRTDKHLRSLPGEPEPRDVFRAEVHRIAAILRQYTAEVYYGAEPYSNSEAKI